MINVLYRTTCTALCDVFNDSFMFMLCQGGIDYVRSNLFDWGFVTASGTWHAIAHPWDQGISSVLRKEEIEFYCCSGRWKRFAMWRSFFYNYGKMEMTKNEGTQNTIPHQLFHNGVNQTWKSFTIDVGCYINPFQEPQPWYIFCQKLAEWHCNENLKLFSMPLGDSSLAYAPACNVRLLRVWLFFTCWTRCGFQRVCGVGETWLQNKHAVDVFVKKIGDMPK